MPVDSEIKYVTMLTNALEKIDKLGYSVFMGKNSCYISKENDEVIVHCNNWGNKITTVYQAVESFINWLNKNK